MSAAIYVYVYNIYIRNSNREFTVPIALPGSLKIGSIYFQSKMVVYDSTLQEAEGSQGQEGEQQNAKKEEENAGREGTYDC